MYIWSEKKKSQKKPKTSLILLDKLISLYPCWAHTQLLSAFSLLFVPITLWKLFLSHFCYGGNRLALELGQKIKQFKKKPKTGRVQNWIV